MERCVNGWNAADEITAGRRPSRFGTRHAPAVALQSIPGRNPVSRADGLRIRAPSDNAPSGILQFNFSPSTWWNSAFMSAKDWGSRLHLLHQVLVPRIFFEIESMRVISVPAPGGVVSMMDLRSDGALIRMPLKRVCNISTVLGSMVSLGGCLFFSRPRGIFSPCSGPVFLGRWDSQRAGSGSRLATQNGWRHLSSSLSAGLLSGGVFVFLFRCRSDLAMSSEGVNGAVARGGRRLLSTTETKLTPCHLGRFLRPLYQLAISSGISLVPSAVFVRGSAALLLASFFRIGHGSP